ncbi:MAG: carboxypeptidase regulatory-like domain-containing protein [Bryobacteraceae bacterium]|nr:carboxypeptidase regulatory-like domain-containing protein [Bryobacteraceae bacterium]
MNMLFTLALPALILGAGEVTGVVVTTSGTPIPEATVKVFSVETAKQAVTARDGRFRIANLTAGEYTVFASENSRYTSPKLIRLAETQQAELVLKLRSTGSISGSVISGKDRRGLTGMRVTAWQSSEKLAGEFEIRGVAQTNDNGEFSIEHLRPGRYFLEVRSPVITVNEAGPRWRRVFYPGGETIRDASPVDLLEGANPGGIRIAVEEVAAQCVTVEVGTAASSDRRVVSILDPDLPQSIAELPIAPSASSVRACGLQEGSFLTRLSVFRGSGPAAMDSSRISVRRGKETIVRLNAIPKCRISGLIQLPDDLAKEVTTADQRFAFSLRPADRLPYPDELMPFPVTLNQPFQVEVFAGEYRAEVSGLRPPLRVKALEVGNTDLLRNRGGVACGAELKGEVAADSGQVSGQVTDSETGKPHPFARVILAPKDSPDEALISAADQNGQFRISRVPPGKYRLSAGNEDDDLAVLRNRSKSRGEELEVTAKGILTRSTSVGR